MKNNWLPLLILMVMVISLSIMSQKKGKISNELPPEVQNFSDSSQILIGSTYLYFPFDTNNPFNQGTYDTVTVIDTLKGYILFYGGWLGEQSSSIDYFLHHSMLHEKDGGYLP